MQTATQVSERPILMSGPMVLATLRERDPKTQTRRVITPQPEGWATQVSADPAVWCWCRHGDQDYSELRRCPYGKPGDRLWVREAMYLAPADFFAPSQGNLRDTDGRRRVGDYVATMDSDAVRVAQEYGVKVTPSIHMPRWASRLTLEIVSVRVERLQEITNEDAVAEGFAWIPRIPRESGDVPSQPDPYEQFAEAWDRLNAKRGYDWNSDPFVWVIEFERLEPQAAQA